MTFAKAYERRCAKCGALFRTDAPGARYTNPKNSPRYVHPGCAKGDKPKANWTLVQ